ncbi:MAG: GDSL-type esterase/lipase family protein [Bacteroidota bacterium]|nr:GDSL-type esterase/lipase family protein [Bacteroidota bacterium]
MKFRIPYLIFFSAFIQFSCDNLNDSPSSDGPYPPLPAFDVQWNEQNTLVCFGTSLTYGYGAGEKKFGGPGPIGGIGGIGGNTPSVSNTGDSSYPRFLQEQLKITVLNKGYVARTISYALSVVTDSVISKKPALVLVEFGANDFLQNISAHTADSLLSLLVTRIQNSGTKVVLLSFINTDMLQYSNGSWSSEDSLLALEYNSMIKSVASRFAVPLIDYPLKGIFGHPNLMSDGFHPNGAGYKKMEGNIYQALIKTFEKNGMVK